MGDELHKTRKPNEKMLEVIRRIAKQQKDQPLTSGKDTLKLIRRARDGEMFGLPPSDPIDEENDQD
jgi:hypothetical protein